MLIVADVEICKWAPLLIFIWYVAALLNGFIVKRYRQSRAIVIGGIALTLGYGLVLPALPFPALCASYVFIGFGVALVQSGANVYVGELPDSTMMLNFLHGMHAKGEMMILERICVLTTYPFFSIFWSWCFGWTLCGFSCIITMGLEYHLHDLVWVGCHQCTYDTDHFSTREDC